MHIYELALRTLLMGFDAAAPPAAADARFVFPRFVSVLTVQCRKTGRGGGGDSKQEQEQLKHDFAQAIYHLSPFAT